MTASSNNSSSESSGVSSENSPTSREDEAVYLNKQLIAHLLKTVCSPQRSGGNVASSIINNNNSYSSSNSNRHSSSVPAQYSASGSSRSRSPDESAPAEQKQQRSASSTFDYLTASSLSGPSASSAYISPFALSPLSEASPWSQPAISLDVVKDARTQELERILLRLCDEFEPRLHDKFRDFIEKLDTQPASIKDSVNHQLDTLWLCYDDNIHWGRVIAVFVLCREICDKCCAEGRPQLATAVQQWVAEFIDQTLWHWMLENQGWLGLLKFYCETGGERGSSGAGSWSPITSLLTISAVSIAIALAATYFRR